MTYLYKLLLDRVDNPFTFTDEQVKAAQAEQRNAEGRVKQLEQVGYGIYVPNGMLILNLMFI